jgi:ParB family transcriptional regulator, chromosome partitioning protein
MAKKKGLPDSIKMKHDYHLVDEISRRTRTPVIRNIPLEKLHASENQPRKDFGDLGELADSIKEKGILEPIIVRPRDGKFEIIAGERRLQAAKLAGLTEVPCIEYDVPDNEALELSIIENIQRKDLNVFEEAFSIQTLAEIYGYTHQDIAQKIGKSRVTVTELIRVTDLPEEIVAKCLNLKINSKTFLLQLVKTEDPATMNQILDAYQENSFSRDVIKEQREEAKENAEKGEDASDHTGALRRIKYNVISENKSIKINFNLRKEGMTKEGLVDFLEKLILDIKENKIEEFRF